jgi:hypothetical protein
VISGPANFGLKTIGLDKGSLNLESKEIFSSNGMGDSLTHKTIVQKVMRSIQDLDAPPGMKDINKDLNIEISVKIFYCKQIH